MEEAMAPAEARYREYIMTETWGHLAPKRNKTYTGEIIWALDLYDSGYLNPKVLKCELGDLPDSPWFYSAMMDFLRSLTDRPDGDNRKQEDETTGRLYIWKGTFRNYKFSGTFQQILVPGLGGTTTNRFSAKLTKKHFETIAAEVRVLPPTQRTSRFNQILPELTKSNPRFDEKRFRQACGV